MSRISSPGEVGADQVAQGESAKDSERWRPVAGFPGYDVSDFGRVRSWRVIGAPKRTLSSPRILRAATRSYGYDAVHIYSASKGKTREVHTLVAEAFLGPRPTGLEIRHLDGDKHNNCAANLAYGTRRENAADTVRHGTSPIGERNARAILTGPEVDAIRFAHSLCRFSIARIAREFGVSRPAVSLIVNRKSWSHRPDCMAEAVVGEHFAGLGPAEETTT